MASRREVLVGAGALAGAGAVGVGAASQVRTDGLSAVTPRADTWPMLRYDPANTGWNTAAALPSDPSVKWRTDKTVVPDPRWGRRLADVPLVVGRDRVYARGASLAALDRSDGSIEWESARTSAGVAVAVLDRTVYLGLLARAGGGRLAALDTTDGRKRWETDLEGPPLHLVAGEDTLVLGAGRTAVALGRDGRRRWRQHRGDGPDRPAIHDGSLYLSGYRLRRYPSPSLLDAALGDRPDPAWRTGAFDDASVPAITDGRAVTVGRLHRVPAKDGLLAVDPDGGSVRWSAIRTPDTDGDRVDEEDIVRTSAPVLSENHVVLRTGVGPEVDRETARVAAFSTADGSLAWEREDLGVVRRVVGVDDAVIAVGGDGEDGGLVTALEAASGDARWQVAFDDPVTSVAPVDGAAFAATDAGTVAKLR